MLGNRYEGSGSGARDRSNRLPCGFWSCCAQGAPPPARKNFRRTWETMKLKFFLIPIDYCYEPEAELNRFLSCHKVISVDRHMVVRHDQPCWAICVEYTDVSEATSDPKKKLVARSRVDYKTILSEKEFLLFSELRKLRKAISLEEGVPVYALFSNEQLATISQKQCSSRTDLEQIDGIGTAKLEKFSDRILQVINRLGELH